MRVRKVRLTWLATRVQPPPFAHGHFSSIANLTAAWSAPNTLRLVGLDWHHPWLDVNQRPVGPDSEHWRRVMELNSALRDQVNVAFVKRLLKYAVPLRADYAIELGDTDLPITSAYAEAILQPWAATGAVTMTLTYPDQGARITTAAADAQSLRNSPTLHGGGAGPALGPAVMADQIAALVASNVTTEHELSGGLGPATIATIIDADVPDAFEDMTNDAEFCHAMQMLAGTNAPLLGFEYVKVADFGRPTCISSELRTVLKSGVAQWAQGALVERPSDPLAQTGALHRSTTLRWATYSSLHGLLDTCWPATDPNWFGKMRDRHRDLFVRYFAPSRRHPDWIGQAYVDSHGIGRLLGGPVPRVDWRCP